MNILGIETSCDETAVCILRGTEKERVVLGDAIASQISTHQKYGGVVPEVAAREHVTSIIPTIELAFEKAGIKPPDIDMIGVTAGPGLVTALRVGVQTAKTLALAWDKKLLAINHIEGHLYANWLGNSSPELPALCLIVSGGHTELILMKTHGDYTLIGRTRDDAVGEAFDKVAKILGIGYPGGPLIEKAAMKGNPKAFDFPRPMMNHNNYEFSFAGLKTSVLYLIQRDFKNKKIPLQDICASFQQAAVDVLVKKTVQASKEHDVKSVLLAGGVAANTQLREQLQTALSDTSGGKLFYHIPPINICTDNATMIAIASYFRAQQSDYCDIKTLDADPSWELV